MDAIAVLPAGEIVKVVDKLVIRGMVRARLESPAGWITILVLESGLHCQAE